MNKKLFTVFIAFIMLFTSFGASAYASTSVGQPFSYTRYLKADTFDGQKVHYGVDVSEWQEEINWKKAAKSGVEFAMIRVGYSRVHYKKLKKKQDKYYKENLEGAQKAGVKTGIYYFSQAKTEEEAVEEAKYLVKKLDGYDITLPVAIDFEFGPGYRINALKAKSRTYKTNVCMAFCNVIREAGYTPMVYANLSTLNHHMKTDVFRENDVKIWAAQYAKGCDLKGEYMAWQCSSSASVPGMKGAIDLDFIYGYDELFDSMSEKKPTKVNSIRKVSSDTGSVKMEWTPAAGKKEYHIYRSSSYGGEYKLVGTTKATSYRDSGLTAGREYYYKVCAANGAGEGSLSSKLSGIVRPETDRYGKVKKTIKIRFRAGNSYGYSTKARKGSTVTIFAKTKDSSGAYWYKVRYNGRIGYVKAESLSTWKKGALKKGMALRSTASMSSAKKKYIYAGESVSIKKTKTVDNNKWYYVKYKVKKHSYYGWIRSDYLKAKNV